MKLGLSVDWDRRTICIREPLDKTEPELRIRWSIKADCIAFQGEQNMAVTMKDTEKVSVAISVVDAKGNPAQIDGVPVWSVSDPAGLAFLASTDGLSCEIAAVGPLGTYQATVEVDADLGVGVRSLIGILDFEIVAGEAVAVNFSVSAPSPA